MGHLARAREPLQKLFLSFIENLSFRALAGWRKRLRPAMGFLLVFRERVPGTCFGNIGEQALFPYYRVPVSFPCSREDFFLSFFFIFEDPT